MTKIDAYARIPEAVIEDLRAQRNRNPLAKAGPDSNAVFVEIGKNLIVDYIIDMWETAKGTRKVVEQTRPLSGIDYTTELTKE